MKSLGVDDVFQGPASYQITVHGCVDDLFMRRLTNLEIAHTHLKGADISTLSGEITDQSALSGLISMLIDNHYKVISVIKIK
jgi:hypothetical protein